MGVQSWNPLRVRTQVQYILQQKCGHRDWARDSTAANNNEAVGDCLFNYATEKDCRVAGPCEHRGKKTQTRCGECKVFPVCSKSCMKALWKRHKPDCENICTARNAFPNTQLLPGEVITTVMTHGTSLTLERIAVLERKGHAMYDSYGVESLPTKGSPMSKPKKLALYVDVLNSKENKDLPLVERYLLNSFHNNVYRHGKEHLEREEWVNLHFLMKIFRVGAFHE